jgi:hypothetical protein
MTHTPRSHAPCRRHRWATAVEHDMDHMPTASCTPGCVTETFCLICGREQSPALAKRGRNNRKRGNSHELAIARKYGGEKVGPLGLPEDIRGAEYRTQVKTHQRPAPAEWRKAFASLEAVTDNRTPRLIVRFLQPGVPADDYIIIKGRDFLDRFGRDDEEESDAA